MARFFKPTLMSNSKNKSANIAEEQQKKPTAIVPDFKTFEFDPMAPNFSIEECDKVVNDWIRDSTFKGENPMPGKCFSNHMTGKLYYVVVRHLRVQVPENYIKKD